MDFNFYKLSYREVWQSEIEENYLEVDCMEKIITNKIRCKKCGDIIESTHRHDFKFCKCGAVAVDGGKDYLRRCGNHEEWEELSEYSD